MKQLSVLILSAFGQVPKEIFRIIEKQIYHLLHNVRTSLPLELPERVQYLVVEGFVKRGRCGHQCQMVSLDRGDRWAEPCCQHRPYLIQGVWLRKVVVHPCCQAPLSRTYPRHGDDWGSTVREGFAPSNFCSRLIPIHLGHLAIHKDQPELAAGVPVERA